MLLKSARRCWEIGLSTIQSFLAQSYLAHRTNVTTLTVGSKSLEGCGYLTVVPEDLGETPSAGKYPLSVVWILYGCLSWSRVRE